MNILDLFNEDAFSVTTLTAAINNEEYKPGRIGEMGIFDERGINTTTLTIESQDNVLSLVGIEPRGASGAIPAKASRAVVPFVVPHMPQRDTILADSLQNVRAFGSADSTQGVQQMVNDRLAAMARKNEYTLESHRVAAVQGKYFDAAGTQKSIYDAFGVAEQVVPLGVTVEATEVRAQCGKVVDKMEEALGGLSYDHIHVLCGKTFWDQLITHKSVKETYLNQSEASALRGDSREILKFGGLTFERYNGTQHVKIEPTEARAFPVGVMDFFLTRFAPANYMETVNTIGLPYYAKTQVMPFDKGVELEVQSNALNLCTRPKALIKLKNTAT